MDAKDLALLSLGRELQDSNYRFTTITPTSHPIPPQPHPYGAGDAAPGPSYLDDGRGARNHWTTRNTVFAAWNMLHAARRIVDQGGIPAHGNLSTNWDLSDPDHPNPEPL